MPTPELATFDALYRVVHGSPCRLDDLIATVGDRAGGDPLDQLSAASVLAADVDLLADRLRGHFVERARQAGHPWSGIGAALGVTRQAAQQRFVQPDLTRYTARARQALEGAQDAARRVGAPAVGPEHVLIGLATVPEGVAAAALGEAGAPHEALERRLAASAPGGGAAGSTGADGPPLSAQVARLVGYQASAEAAALGHNYVGTEHLLLALLRPPAPAVGPLLASMAVEPDTVRGTVLRLLSGSGAGRPG